MPEGSDSTFITHDAKYELAFGVPNAYYALMSVPGIPYGLQVPYGLVAKRSTSPPKKDDIFTVNSIVHAPSGTQFRSRYPQITEVIGKVAQLDTSQPGPSHCGHANVQLVASVAHIEYGSMESPTYIACITLYAPGFQPWSYIALMT